MAPDKNKDSATRAAMKFIVTMGLVSLFADITYEGCRGISGQYLSLLGASATTVGIVCGGGELIGYGLRFFSGYLADRTRRYWLITIVGYAVNLLAVPALALAGRWEIAALLLILERLGKAIRTPARDTMLSYAGSRVGQGFGFGLHEAMDQIGAITGPCVMAFILAGKHSYQAAFAVLLLPALLSLATILVARLSFPVPGNLEVKAPKLSNEKFPRHFYLYVVAVSLVAFGYADFPLLAYHLNKVAAVETYWIPAFYAFAMAVDAAAALILGFLFDRFGFALLPVSFFLSSFFAPLVFLGGWVAVAAGIALWGLGMGAQESIMRAAVANMVDTENRASAYGWLGMSYGIAWFLGSALMGFLYQSGVNYVIAVSVASQLLSLPVFIFVQREFARANAGKT